MSDLNTVWAYILLCYQCSFPVDDFDFLDDIDDCGEIVPDFARGEEEYLHLHQLFVTKNPVLCREVEKNFEKLQHAEDVVPDVKKTLSLPLPNSLQVFYFEK